MERARCDRCGVQVDGVVFPAETDGKGRILMDGSNAYYEPCGHRMQAAASDEEPYVATAEEVASAQEQFKRPGLRGHSG